MCCSYSIENLRRISQDSTVEAEEGGWNASTVSVQQRERRVESPTVIVFIVVAREVACLLVVGDLKRKWWGGL